MGSEAETLFAAIRDRREGSTKEIRNGALTCLIKLAALSPNERVRAKAQDWLYDNEGMVVTRDDSIIPTNEASHEAS